MSYLLTDPRTVVALGFSPGTRESLESAFRDGPVESIEPVAEHGSDLEALVGRDDVGCALVGDETDVDPVAACQRVTAADDLLPVVAAVADGSEQLAHRFLRAGGSEYVPLSAGMDAVRSTVEAAIDRYERRRGEHAQSSMFDTLLEDSTISLYAKDREARYVRKSVVPAGRNPEAVIGKTDPEVYDDTPDAAREWYEDDRDVVRTGEGIYGKEEKLETGEGEHWSRTTKVPWYDGDELQGLIGVSFDITEYVESRYRLEEYRERFDKFVNAVTHDLYNPLQVASGNLELARETGDEEAFERATTALDRIDEMLGDFSAMATEEEWTLSQSRVADRSEEAVSLDSVRLVDLAEKVWAVLETDDATLECQFPSAARIYSPESAIRPVLENLLKNAVRHAGPAATVRVGHLPDGGLFVEDDGPGIPEEERDRIFEEGYSTDSEGSGTGLAIVSDVAESQGWTVEVTDGDLGGARIDIHNCLVVTTEEMAETTGSPIELTERTNVGEFDVETSATYDEESDEWTVVGGGMNVWQATNEFFFVHAAAEGPVTIRGRVRHLEEVGQYSKAGFMVRDDLTTDATYGHIGVIPDARTEVLWRTGRGEDGVSQFVDRESDAQTRYRVDRVGDTITVAVSSDGEDWTPVNERRVDLTDPVHVGLVVCSYRPNSPCRAVFDDVAVHRLDVDDG